jgi:nucleoside-diphosphate-sugar epimerase
VLERNVASPRFHGAAEEGVSFKEVATVIGRRLGLRVVSKTLAEAADHFGSFAQLALKDIPASSERTRTQLGWEPKEIGLIADISSPEYFET